MTDKLTEQVALKATPGPYQIGMKREFGTYSPNTIFALGPDGEEDGVATVHDIPLHVKLEEINHSGTWDKGLATAHLLAASWEMYQALKFAQEIILDQVKRFHRNCRCQLCESLPQEIAAALRKAEGR